MGRWLAVQMIASMRCPLATENMLASRQVREMIVLWYTERGENRTHSDMYERTLSQAMWRE
jgi:hypothetical protein